jgi:RecA-family ATPase
VSKTLTVIDGASLLALDVEPPRFIVARLVPAGLHLLAGSPKIGKSWLALWLCNQVSCGGKVWEFDKQKCGTLYISLEDTIDRLHLRLSRITEHGSKDILFATTADNLTSGLIEQLESFIKEYPDTGLIVIDTFQRIRDGDNESTYANDYREVVKVKALADKFKIAVLLIHHLRKAPDSDPFNMVSGSTGIIGAVDSIYVLEKAKRIENGAILHVTGRDMEDMQIKLEFDRDPPVWKLAFIEAYHF